MRCKFSDDDGYTWQDAGIDMPYKRNPKYDHPGPDVLSRCIVWQKPIRDAKDRPVVPLTRSTAAYLRPFSKDKNLGECRCEFIRYENIDEGPHPRDLKLTYLPKYWKWLSMYASFTEHRGKRILWYADRKIFVLGRTITDEMLADMTVPKA